MPVHRRAAATARPRRSVRPRLAESTDAGSPAPMDVQTAPVPTAGPARGLPEGDGATHSGQARHTSADVFKLCARRSGLVPAFDQTPHWSDTQDAIDALLVLARQAAANGDAAELDGLGSGTDSDQVRSCRPLVLTAARAVLICAWQPVRSRPCTAHWQSRRVSWRRRRRARPCQTRHSAGRLQALPVSQEMVQRGAAWCVLAQTHVMTCMCKQRNAPCPLFGAEC